MFLSLKIGFVSANSEDPDEMPHYVAFHLGLHCLPKYLFRVSGVQRVNNIYIFIIVALDEAKIRTAFLCYKTIICVIQVTCTSGQIKVKIIK